MSIVELDCRLYYEKQEMGKFVSWVEFKGLKSIIWGNATLNDYVQECSWQDVMLVLKKRWPPQ